MNRGFLTGFQLKGELLEGAACPFTKGPPHLTVLTPMGAQ